MHQGMTHKAKLNNCDKCDYSCTKNKVPVMHKFKSIEGKNLQGNSVSSVTSPA